MEAGVRMKILVVDDEPDIVEYLCTALEDNGYDARGVTDAAKALAAAAEFKPDAILLDVMMPGQSGLALYREARSLPGLAGIPVIFLSGYPASKGNGAGKPRWSEWNVPPPEGFLDKPVSVESLLSMLGPLLAFRKKGGADG